MKVMIVYHAMNDVAVELAKRAKSELNKYDSGISVRLYAYPNQDGVIIPEPSVDVVLIGNVYPKEVVKHMEKIGNVSTINERMIPFVNKLFAE